MKRPHFLRRWYWAWKERKQAPAACDHVFAYYGYNPQETALFANGAIEPDNERGLKAALTWIEAALEAIESDHLWKDYDGWG